MKHYQKDISAESPSRAIDVLQTQLAMYRTVIPDIKEAEMETDPAVKELIEGIKAMEHTESYQEGREDTDARYEISNDNAPYNKEVFNQNAPTGDDAPEL